MTGKIAIMTGLAFTLGVVVGVLFHLPGTTSPSTFRTRLGRERYGSPWILRGWRQRLSSGESGFAVSADSPYSSMKGRKGEKPGFRSGSGIPRIVPELNRVHESRKDDVNKDYNDKGFIHSRNNPRINSSQPSVSAVIAYHDRQHKPSSLINLGATSQVDGNRETHIVRSKILSVLQNIEVVQLEKDSLQTDIARQRIESGIGASNGGHGGQLGSERGSRYFSIESRKSTADSSNISNQNSVRGTPMANNEANNTGSRFDLGGPSQDSARAERQSNTRSHPSAARKDKPADIVNGVFWSEELENFCPRGFPDDVYSQWRETVARTDVVGVDEGCGRMQNRRLTFQDSTSACARYRPNTDQIQGEIYSYYLSRLLRINNVPPSVLLSVKSSEKTWANVGREIAMSQWGEDKLVVLTKWIDGLEPAYIPTELKGDTKKVYPKDIQLLNKSVSELCELVQWSDLIIFDYLTANLDRVVNNMFNQQWNSQMMSFPAHNLHKIKDTDSLVFLDNESGLFHGYRLLDKYSKYHVEMLSAVCVFRARTVREIERLFLEDSLEVELNQLLTSNESQAKNLPTMPDKNIHILKQRLQDVYEQIQKCQRLVNR